MFSIPLTRELMDPKVCLCGKWENTPYQIGFEPVDPQNKLHLTNIRHFSHQSRRNLSLMYSDAAFNLLLIQCEWEFCRSSVAFFVGCADFDSILDVHKLISFKYLNRGKAFRGCLLRVKRQIVSSTWGNLWSAVPLLYQQSLPQRIKCLWAFCLQIGLLLLKSFYASNPTTFSHDLLPFVLGCLQINVSLRKTEFVFALFVILILATIRQQTNFRPFNEGWVCWNLKFSLSED